MTEKPHYVVQFSAANCMFDIRVNDISVITLNLEGQAMTNVPLNYAISHNGEQKVTAKILPLYGESKLQIGAEFYYNILSYDVSNGFVLKDTLEAYKAPKVTEDNPVSILTNTFSFNAKVPFKVNDVWTNGQNLKDIKSLEEKLRNAYNEIGQLVTRKDFDTLISLMKTKESNIAKSLYLTQEDTNARMKSLIMDINDGFDHIDIPQETVIVYSAHGKIASLKRPNGEPALSLMNRELKEEIMLDLDFYLPENSDEFQII